MNYQRLNPRQVEEGSSYIPIDPSLQKTIRRKKTVNARQGRFTLHVPVAHQVLEGCPYRNEDEFTHLTYTAVTEEQRPPGNLIIFYLLIKDGANEHDYPHEADTFKFKYQLRQRALSRQIKVALVMTMYNEDDILFLKSMRSVQINIEYLCWGQEGWKNFLVVIVSDGRQKINPRVLTVLNVMGIYQDNLHRTQIDQVPVAAHFYEFTTQISIRNAKIEVRKVPTQVVFILKEKNAKKINSHKWFFNAVCDSVIPEVTMLLDVGTKPSDKSLYHLYRAFQRNPMVGGACGEIKAELGFGWKNLWNPMVAGQNFEYKMSNILDKPLESICGYISVLPGAFSAYRYVALQGRPLEQYFAGENPLADIFTSNLYLAEDRILCFELVTKRNEAYILKYVKSANAETDVPDTLDELVSQRRRWLNGSFFCSVHALMHFTQIYRSPHSFIQKFLFNVRKNLSLEEFTSKDQLDPFAPYGDQVFSVLDNLYKFLLFTMFITALGNRPRGTRWLYKTMCVFFALIMSLMLFMSGYTIYTLVQLFLVDRRNWLAIFLEKQVYRDMVLSVVSTYLIYLLASIIHLDPWHIFTCLIQYLLLIPTYLNVFMIYSFSNLHDVTWGTKGATTAEPIAAVKKTVGSDGEVMYEFEAVEPENLDNVWLAKKQQMLNEYHNPPKSDNKRSASDKRTDATKTFRTKIVLFWIICNTLLILIFTNEYVLGLITAPPKSEKDIAINPYLAFLLWSVAALGAVRFVGSCIFMVQWSLERMRDRAESLMLKLK
ncbi:Chitin synthase, class 1 [Globomyces sp. JEL0801]|nr:Chitin synthase, class 1 [Globomyces sp. JEL0801]